mmetsp:Transcript_23542/g.55613  ORF Transcript_23542/g.55613 Transcript_23542/m.55613 type:complete len:374 (-) Transcript_23542:728-1849(-)
MCVIPLLHHPRHAAHAPRHSPRRAASLSFLRGHVSDHALARREKTGHARGIHDARPRNLRRVDDPRLVHVRVHSVPRVESHLDGRVGLRQLATDDGPLLSRVHGYGRQRRPEGLLDYLDADPLVHVLGRVGDLIENCGAVEKSLASPRDNALLDGRPRRVEGVDDAVLLLVHLDLTRAPDLDHCDASRELSKAFLELLPLVVRLGRLDAGPDQLAPLVDEGLCARSVEYDRVVLSNLDSLRGTQLLGRGLLDLHPRLLRDNGPARQDGEVLHRRLAVIAKTRRLDGAHLDPGAELVDHKRGQGLALDVLGHDQQALLRLDHPLQDRDELLDARHLLLHEEDHGVLELANLRLGVGDEVGRDETALEPHPLDDL